MRIPGIVLAALATMRLTRLVVTDDVGKWWVRDPIKERARYATIDALKLVDEQGHTPDSYRELRRASWLNRLDDGVRCPFCIGFWIGTAVLASYAAAGRTRLWRFTAGALALNYVSAHVGSRLGDVYYDDDDDEDFNGEGEG